MARIASDENDKIIKMGSYESLQDTFEHSKIWSTIFQKLNVKTTIRYTKLIKLLPDMVKHSTLNFFLKKYILVQKAQERNRRHRHLPRAVQRPLGEGKRRLRRLPLLQELLLRHRSPREARQLHDPGGALLGVNVDRQLRGDRGRICCPGEWQSCREDRQIFLIVHLSVSIYSPA